MGGEFAPSIVERVPLRSDDELIRLLHNGLPSSGMPAFPDVVDQERANLISFLRTLKPFWGTAAARASVTLEDGKMLRGTAKPFRKRYAAAGRRPSTASSAQD
jgi:alcohol dehydrogenase (cytochrome c)